MGDYLTKSRFKLGVECPTKLFYTSNKRYANSKSDDEFLKALAQGGFQVEELARLEFENGILIEGNSWEHKELVESTNKLLERENVVLFEPAFLTNNCFVRADILVKRGKKVELFEVKAKSISLHDEYYFIGKRGEIKADWKEHFYDIAFQKYVIQKSFPEWEIKPFIVLVDKNKKATVDGLNQKFKISSNSSKRTGIIVEQGLTKSGIGESILAKFPVNHIISHIFNKKSIIHGSNSFGEVVQLFVDSYIHDEKIKTPINIKCKSCEFINEAESKLKSGFDECWKEQLLISNKLIDRPKVYDLANFKSANKFMSQGKFFMVDLTRDNLTSSTKSKGLSISERQWLQVIKEKENDSSAFIDIKGLTEELSEWIYPLNFIDFETSTVAIPFNKGRKPYEQICFQFSHHTVQSDGTIIHESEFINTEAGIFPNFKFIRALKDSLSKNTGSIFRYSHHENTVLNVIHNQLKSSKEDDRNELMEFIETISHSTSNNLDTWEGDRDMIDLCEVVKLFYFDPYTKGSNSIKAVLPAILHSNSHLKNKYTKPIKNINLSSINFNEDKIWLHLNEKNEVISPYSNLPNLFEDWPESELDSLISEIEGIDNGGTVLIAYSRLQFQEMTYAERKEINNALLMYCELDTLAMVMIYEFFKNHVDNPE